MVSAYLRINKEEEKNLTKLSKNVNRERLDRDMPVIKESEVLHQLIDEAFKKAKVKDGNVIIE
jgi:hypothetical protein